MFAYDFTVQSAATYYLTANISTWHPNQDVSVAMLRRALQALTALPLTVFLLTSNPLNGHHAIGLLVDVVAHPKVHFSLE
jgi:hypothetical protein